MTLAAREFTRGKMATQEHDPDGQRSGPALSGVLRTGQVSALAEEVIGKAAATPAGSRYLLGVAGVPAAGKSTLAKLLVATINEKSGAETAALVPMDGFHLPNHVLEAHGIRHLKGIPETFDAGAFVKLLAKIRESTDGTILCPVYDRRLHAPVPDALAINALHRAVIVEGNYLLYDRPPWDQIASLLDEVWFLATPFSASIGRLIDRHMAGGRTRDEAMRKIESTDRPNAALVEATRPRANRIITFGDGTQDLDPRAHRSDE